MVVKYRSHQSKLAICLVFSTGCAVAQNLDFANYYQPADITAIREQIETQPLDDAVLQTAPVELQLKFSEQVRLVKLTLRNQVSNWVDISFRYDPQLNNEFEWQLPQLPTAVYYTADWAVLAVNDHLVRGSFSFSFGPDAEPPSIVRAAEELLQELRANDSGGRYVSPPPTEIIINRDPPSFDPPFTIDLQDQN